MPSLRSTAKRIAIAASVSEVSEEALVQSVSLHCLESRKPRWLRPLARRLAAEFGDRSKRISLEEWVSAICECRPFANAWQKGKLRTVHYPVSVKPKMMPAAGAPSGWKVPATVNETELAKLLGLDAWDLGWLCSRNPKICHYHYQWRAKRSGKGRRLIEIPKPMLKQTQEEILRKILSVVPAHESAVGFEAGNSVFDFVQPHVQRHMVLRLDLRDFFASVSAARVRCLFETLGYPESVAKCLTRLTTSAVPLPTLMEKNFGYAQRQPFLLPHLPQGAPTSPALANRCAFRLDCRLAGLSRSLGVRYTRYADDLLFSGDKDFSRSASRFHDAVSRIVIEEGFRLHIRKTEFMRRSQRQKATGLVLNEKPNVSRKDYDQLKATLTNCVRLGWESQNREDHPEFQQHLLGKIHWVRLSNPNRAEKLMGLFDQVDWE